jgi:hypothetical protein
MDWPLRQLRVKLSSWQPREKTRSDGVDVAGLTMSKEEMIEIHMHQECYGNPRPWVTGLGTAGNVHTTREVGRLWAQQVQTDSDSAHLQLLRCWLKQQRCFDRQGAWCVTRFTSPTFRQQPNFRVTPPKISTFSRRFSSFCGFQAVLKPA